MARAIVVNRATSCSDQRPMNDHSWRTATDGTINRSLPPATDRTSNRGILWPSVRSIVAPEDRWYDQSWGATIDRMINRSIAQPIVRSIVATWPWTWTWPSTLLRLILHLQSPTTSATSRTTYATSCTLFIRFAHDSNIVQSQVGRNLVLSPVWLGLYDFWTWPQHCCDRFCPGDHPRPLRPVVRSFNDLPTIPTVFSRR